MNKRKEVFGFRKSKVAKTLCGAVLGAAFFVCVRVVRWLFIVAQDCKAKSAIKQRVSFFISSSFIKIKDCSKRVVVAF